MVNVYVEDLVSSRGMFHILGKWLTFTSHVQLMDITHSYHLA